MNTFFQFKQFTIHQDKCAMKVCTDACLFGAYIAENITTNKYCLDIGAGTGLLSVMLAQKNDAMIEAIEIDTHAFQQAKENLEQSPWKERLHIFNIDAIQFLSEKKYDFIFSNPPFFGNDLKSDNQQKNAAKHDTTLTLGQLIMVIENNLSNDGVFALLLPYRRVDECITIAAKANFHLKEKILVKQTPSHDFFRGILFFSRKETNIKTEEIFIKDSANQYTDRFTHLLKDYYLYL